MLPNDEAYYAKITLREENVILKEDLELLAAGYKELAEAYHQLGHIIAADRHNSKHYHDCDEQSCALHRDFLNNILLGK